MKKILLVLLVIAAAAGGWYYWQRTPAPQPVSVTSPPQPAPTPAPREAEAPPRQVLELPQAPPTLPALDESDATLSQALAALIDNPALMKLLRLDQAIRNIVVTLDSLPGRRAPPRYLPFAPASGRFLTAGNEEELVISRDNAARYTPYMAIADAIDPAQLVGLYLRLYPLFQQAYEELGYPGAYFNDRLLVVLDDLLNTPDIAEPVRLVRPKYYYLYADPELEARSIGQRTLMRIGSANAARLKEKLRAIRRELLLHMREEGRPPAAT